MQSLEQLFADAADFVWGYPLLILLVGTHIFLTFRLKFIQRYIGKAIKLSLQRGSRWTRCRVVDVAHWRLRHRDEIRRGPSFCEVSGENERRPDGRRTNVRA